MHSDPYYINVFLLMPGASHNPSLSLSLVVESAGLPGF